LILTACSSSAPDRSIPQRAPWRNEPIASTEVSPLYLEQWRKAENREICAPIAPRALSGFDHATPRAATFAGGWAVAYDLPDLRSAFGVAGAGVRASDPSYSDWPYVWNFENGGKVEYGPEGGRGPNQLAYVRIQGQECLYNVWSRLGRAHLESLLRELRMIEIDE
jgi:hypothetical protein